MPLDALIARATIAAVAGCGLLGSSPLAIAGGVLILSSLRSEACLAFADRYRAALGRLEAGSLFAAVAAARSTILSTVAYATGLALRLFP